MSDSSTSFISPWPWFLSCSVFSLGAKLDDIVPMHLLARSAIEITEVIKSNGAGLYFLVTDVAVTSNTAGIYNHLIPTIKKPVKRHKRREQRQEKDVDDVPHTRVIARQAKAITRKGASPQKNPIEKTKASIC